MKQGTRGGVMGTPYIPSRPGWRDPETVAQIGDAAQAWLDLFDETPLHASTERAISAIFWRKTVANGLAPVIHEYEMRTDAAGCGWEYHIADYRLTEMQSQVEGWDQI